MLLSVSRVFQTFIFEYLIDVFQLKEKDFWGYSSTTTVDITLKCLQYNFISVWKLLLSSKVNSSFHLEK